MNCPQQFLDKLFIDNMKRETRIFRSYYHSLLCDMSSFEVTETGSCSQKFHMSSRCFCCLVIHTCGVVPKHSDGEPNCILRFFLCCIVVRSYLKHKRGWSNKPPLRSYLCHQMSVIGKENCFYISLDPVTLIIWHCNLWSLTL